MTNNNYNEKGKRHQTHLYKLREALRNNDKEAFLRFALLMLLKKSRTTDIGDGRPATADVLREKATLEMIGLWLKAKPMETLDDDDSLESILGQLGGPDEQ